jgi:hypothetical protein
VATLRGLFDSEGCVQEHETGKTKDAVVVEEGGFKVVEKCEDDVERRTGKGQQYRMHGRDDAEGSFRARLTFGLEHAGMAFTPIRADATCRSGIWSVSLNHKWSKFQA